MSRREPSISRRVHRPSRRPRPHAACGPRPYRASPPASGSEEPDAPDELFAESFATAETDEARELRDAEAAAAEGEGGKSTLEQQRSLDFNRSTNTLMDLKHHPSITEADEEEEEKCEAAAEEGGGGTNTS